MKQCWEPVCPAALGPFLTPCASWTSSMHWRWAGMWWIHENCLRWDPCVLQRHLRQGWVCGTPALSHEELTSCTCALESRDAELLHPAMARGFWWVQQLRTNKPTKPQASRWDLQVPAVNTQQFIPVLSVIEGINAFIQEANPGKPLHNQLPVHAYRRAWCHILHQVASAKWKPEEQEAGRVAPLLVVCGGGEPRLWIIVLSHSLGESFSHPTVAQAGLGVSRQKGSGAMGHERSRLCAVPPVPQLPGEGKNRHKINTFYFPASLLNNPFLPFGLKGTVPALPAITPLIPGTWCPAHFKGFVALRELWL